MIRPSRENSDTADQAPMGRIEGDKAQYGGSPADADRPEPALQSNRAEPPPKGWLGFIKRLVSQFIADDPLTLAASTSFYAALSLAPLILILLTIAAAIWGDTEAASEQIVDQVDQLIGEQGAEVTQSVVTQAAESEQTGWAAVIGIAMLIFAATGLFAQLQDALNRIWDVKAKPGRSVFMFIRKRLLSLGMVLTVGFLLMLSLIASAAINFATESVRVDLPGADALWHGVTIAVSLAVFTLFFAAMFKYLPDVKVPWRTVWVGAAITAVFFIIGKLLIGLYLGGGGVGSAYGAAGSLLVVLVWVYYSSLIIFFGAEFTQVYAASSGHGIEPSQYAVREGEQCGDLQERNDGT